MRGRRTGIAGSRDRGENRDCRSGRDQKSGIARASVDKSRLIRDSTANNTPKTAPSAFGGHVNGPLIDNHHRDVTYLD
jgi:hypothetical protein